ncbi:MAG: MinD/ParA family protein [bacterium]|nr:MinD/ParA family protein [bacterium]
MVDTNPRIWAFGGGKGGVGKSLVATNVGVALAKRGHRCALIDADLGGANLHTLVGGVDSKRTLSDFLERRVRRLEEVVAPTRIPRLSLLSGARALFESPNLKHYQKQSLLRQLKSLGFELVLLDLAAGSSFSTLDFFLSADREILVVVPEPTSVENAYHFLKAAFYRKLKTAARRAGVEPAVKQAMQERASRGIKSPRELIASVCDIDPAAGGWLQEEIDGFRPRLIVNQVRSPSEATLGRDMKRACRDYLGIEIEFIGAIASDGTVRRALQERRPSMVLFPTSPFSSSIQKITDKLLEGRRPSAQQDQLSEDFRVLGLEPGCRLADVISAHRRLKKLYSNPSLATFSEIDEKTRSANLARVEEASRRILLEVSGAIPVADLR